LLGLSQGTLTAPDRIYSTLDREAAADGPSGSRSLRAVPARTGVLAVTHGNRSWDIARPHAGRWFARIRIEAVQD
jgi:hypothetical protein